MTKYRNSKITLHGMTFDSKKEAKRYRELALLEQAGEIYFLRRQVAYLLIPPQYAKSTEVYTKGPNKGQKKPGKLLERSCIYIADFVYRKDGETIVEDVKGYKGGGAYGVFSIKRKLMLSVHNIRVREV